MAIGLDRIVDVVEAPVAGDREAGGHARSREEFGRDLVAVLFAAGAPLATADLARVLDCSYEDVLATIYMLQEYPPTGLSVQRSGDAVQLVSSAEAAPAVERFFGAPPPVKLSRAALEALAVVAYRQPVTRGEIDAVRGVNSDSAISTLLTRGLVAEVGRRDTVGRPALLATTAEFLQYLGLTSLDQLPALPAGADSTSHVDSAR